MNKPKFKINDTVYFNLNYVSFDELNVDITDLNDLIGESIDKVVIKSIDVTKSGTYYYNGKTNLTDTNGFTTEEAAYKFIANKLLNVIIDVKERLELLINPPFKYIPSDSEYFDTTQFSVK